MKIMVSGHRAEKLKSYSSDFILYSLQDILENVKNYHNIIGMSGMASGVDLWFCDICNILKIPYYAYPSFENQDKNMDDVTRYSRQFLLKKAKEVFGLRNRIMVEKCDSAIIVWDGNKGGTHNVFQQLIEKKKDFWWINPVKEKVVLI